MNLSKQKLFILHILGILLLVVASISLGYLFRDKIGYLLSKVQTQKEEITQSDDFIEISPSNLGTRSEEHTSELQSPNTN